MAEIEELLRRAFEERQHDRPEEALRWFVSASELEPKDPTILLEIARTHLDLAEHDRARKILDSINVNGLNSDDAVEMAMELARLWMRAGGVDRALKLFRSIPLDNKAAASQAILESVLLLERTHRLDEAKAELRRHPSIPLRASSRGRTPHLTAALALSVLSEREGDLESAASRLTRALKHMKSSSELTIECGYRLARLLNKMDQPDKARQVANRCKKVERQQMPAQILQQHIRDRRASDLAVVNELPSSWFDSRPVVKGTKRVMILGHARSGTSLLARQLSGATAATWVDECTAFSVIGRQLGRQLSTAGQSFAEYLQSLKDDQVALFESQYEQRMLEHVLPESSGTGSLRLIDKNPGLSNSLPALNRLLPNSAWIYVERDPRDVAVSCYFQRFGSTPLGWACQTLEGAMKAVLHTVRLWTLVKSRLSPEQVVIVRYEDLVKSPEQVIASVVARIDWPDSRGERIAPAEPTIIHSPTYSDVRRPIDSRAVGRWHCHESFFGSLDNADQQLIEDLGYS
jgi:thioredoxin-like negative regulator of GroEL